MLFFKQIFFFLIFTCIIFLTGCASGRYHTPGDFSRRGPLDLDAIPPSFAWPLEGRVAVPYGAQEDHVSAKGITLEAAKNVVVRAAADGRVAFVDERLKGYGRTVIVEHGGGFSTVYARHAENLVKPGDWVRRGDAIAKAGPGGKGGLARLYFEIRKDSRAQDPSRYLGNA